jgi:hypothetical protein
MSLRRIVALLIGLGLIVVGSTVLRDRLEYSPELVLRQRLGNQLKELSSDDTYDLSDACDVFNDRENWILFVLGANQLNDSTMRTYFETADQERIGLWVELEPPLLRLGMGLGLENPESSTLLPIRVVRRSERFIATIAVTKRGTSLVVNGKKLHSDWPDIAGARWSCETLRVGGDRDSLSEGYSCSQCDVRLQYAAGENYETLQRILDSITNVRRFESYRRIGNSLVVGGLIVIVASEVVQRRRRREKMSRLQSDDDRIDDWSI